MDFNKSNANGNLLHFIKPYTLPCFIKLMKFYLLQPPHVEKDGGTYERSS